MNNVDKIKFYILYEKIGKVYIDSFLLPQWDDKEYSDWYTFLKNYAYERQGGNAVYPHIAPELIEKWYKGDLTRQGVINEFEEGLDKYKKYKQSTGSNDSEKVGSNEKRNPLYEGSGKSIMKFISENYRKSLKEILWIIDGNKWNVKEACKKIKGINGIGQKIASFYLRDLKEYHILKEEDEVEIEPKDRWLLQPIDIWVRRMVKEDIETTTPKSKIEDEEIARTIVDLSLENNLNPERVNMGMWFFGSQIIGNRYKLYLLYKDRDYNKFVEYVKDYSKTLSKQSESITKVSFLTSLLHAKTILEKGNI